MHCKLHLLCWRLELGTFLTVNFFYDVFNYVTKKGQIYINKIFKRPLEGNVKSLDEDATSQHYLTIKINITKRNFNFFFTSNHFTFVNVGASLTHEGI